MSMNLRGRLDALTGADTDQAVPLRQPQVARVAPRWHACVMTR